MLNGKFILRHCDGMTAEELVFKRLRLCIEVMISVGNSLHENVESVASHLRCSQPSCWIVAQQLANQVTGIFGH